MGFADAVVAELADRLPEHVRQLRENWDIRPVYKMVDTCAAEFDAQTPYFYSCYEQENEALPMSQERMLVIGSGPIRIGQGIEFDYCSVQAARALKRAGVKAILVNVFGGILLCDLLAQGIVAACQTLNLTVPLVVRLEGTNVEQGRKILEESGLKINFAPTLKEAAEKVVAACGGTA